MKEADQEADQGKPKIKGHNIVEQKLRENERSTDEKEADQEADQEDQEEDQVNLPYKTRSNIEEELQGN